MIVSTDKICDIMKIIKSLLDASFLIKGVSKTTKKKLKEQKG